MGIDFNKILESTNVAELLSEEDLSNIGSDVIENFEQDLRSRQNWYETTEAGMKLAMQIAEEKTYPWPKASNIKMPLITIAALQFNARSYPALISNSSVVKTKIYGEKTQAKVDRASRIQKHMSYQVLEEDEAWEEEMDRLLITVPIVGCSFKKTYFDPKRKMNRSVHVLATDFVVDYFTKSLEDCDRASHRFHLRQNEVVEKQRSGHYLDIRLGKAELHNDQAKNDQDTAQGLHPAGNQRIPREIVEQHCHLDLDDDGYEEPYIVTVDRTSNKVLRIVKRFEVENVFYNAKREIQQIVANQHFTKYGFIPAPDGGFYDLGFAKLMGPTSHGVDTAINQLFDAGTLSNMQAGFLGRGIKLKRGNARFTPGEWKNVNMSGDDIRKNVMPLPVREPSQVLFSLLGLLIEYAERVSSVSDIMAGQNPGQNQAATTSMAVLEQGMKVFTGIFKRIHRCLRSEFKKLYVLNAIYLNDEMRFTYDDETQIISQKDYSNPDEVLPASDPNMVSDAQSAMQAEAIVARAAQVPGYNIDAVERRYLKALRVEDIEEVFPDPKGPNAIQPAPNPEMLKLKLEEDKAKSEVMVKILSLHLEAAHTDAEIGKMEADALLAYAKAEAEEAGPQMEFYKQQLEDLKDRRQSMLKLVEQANNERTRMEGMEGAAAN